MASPIQLDGLPEPDADVLRTMSAGGCEASNMLRKVLTDTLGESSAISSKAVRSLERKLRNTAKKETARDRDEVAALANQLNAALFARQIEDGIRVNQQAAYMQAALPNVPPPIGEAEPPSGSTEPTLAAPIGGVFTSPSGPALPPDSGLIGQIPIAAPMPISGGPTIQPPQWAPDDPTLPGGHQWLPPGTVIPGPTLPRTDCPPGTRPRQRANGIWDCEAIVGEVPPYQPPTVQPPVLPPITPQPPRVRLPRKPRQPNPQKPEECCFTVPEDELGAWMFSGFADDWRGEYLQWSEIPDPAAFDDLEEMIDQRPHDKTSIPQPSGSGVRTP